MSQAQTGNRIQPGGTLTGLPTNPGAAGATAGLGTDLIADPVGIPTGPGGGALINPGTGVTGNPAAPANPAASLGGGNQNLQGLISSLFGGGRLQRNRGKGGGGGGGF